MGQGRGKLPSEIHVAELLIYACQHGQMMGNPLEVDAQLMALKVLMLQNSYSSDSGTACVIAWSCVRECTSVILCVPA